MVAHGLQPHPRAEVAKVLGSPPLGLEHGKERLEEGIKVLRAMVGSGSGLVVGVVL